MLQVLLGRSLGDGGVCWGVLFESTPWGEKERALGRERGGRREGAVKSPQRPGLTLQSCTDLGARELHPLLVQAWM